MTGALRPARYAYQAHEDFYPAVVIAWRNSPTVGVAKPFSEDWDMYLEIERWDEQFPKFVHVERVLAPRTWFSALPLEVR